MRVAFNSNLLKKRITNTIYLPATYRPDGPPQPVMYALHGTVFPPLNNCAIKPITDAGGPLVHMLGCGGGDLQDKLYDIPANLDRMKFIVVSPDTDAKKSVCETCTWINGRNDIIPNIQPATASTLPADSFLHRELYPLIESLFDTRTDRGGRGVMGFSMGGWAAALQGMLHPDDYSYVGWVSGGYDIFEPGLQSFINAAGYLRDQGYGTSITDPIWWRQYNPKEIVTNVEGTGTRFLLSSGDSCLGLSSLTAADCQGRFSPASAPLATALEMIPHQSWKIAKSDMAGRGIPYKAVEFPGVHGSNNHRVFADYIVPGANSTFTGRVSSPAKFSYKSVIPNFSVWGYDVNVTRANVGFLSMTDARLNGRSFTLDGTGVIELLTPAKFTPGATYTVTGSANGARSTKSVTADKHGRIRVNIDLSHEHLLDAGTGGGTAAGGSPHRMTISVDGRSA